jgi:hypothetical protein
MDHEVVPRPCKFVISCWTCPRITSVSTEEKRSKWPWSSRSPKEIFESPHHPLTWSNGFCCGRGKRGAHVEKGKGPWQRNIIIIINLYWIFFREKKTKARENKRMVKLEKFSKLSFLGIFKKNQHNHFWVHDHSSWSTFDLQLVRGPKTL